MGQLSSSTRHPLGSMQSAESNWAESSAAEDEEKTPGACMVGRCLFVRLLKALLGMYPEEEYGLQERRKRGKKHRDHF